MDFLPDDEQESLIEATRNFIESCIPLSFGSPTHLDDVGWKEIAELGWLGLATDVDAGGAGATLLDEVFIFREIGRGLVPGPILTTLAAARFAAWTHRTSLASDLIGGQARVARAVALPGHDDRLLLLDPYDSALTLLIDDDHIALYTTPQHFESSPGLEDQSFVGRISIADLGTASATTDDYQTVHRLQRVISILTCAQLAGIAGATCDLATQYAKDRIQFGKPIGAFQAIKHCCADMAVNALAADNIAFFAALTATAEASAHHVLAAAAYCRRAALANARANVQIHGAMGFTVEDIAHRFVKRANALCITESFERAPESLGRLPFTQKSEDP